ncbi:MAG: hypothetical protein K8S55_00225 [Phycisphaerae bacterium]|nr:hypothetical protein [Phycisphaerae bacterium]
MPLLGMEQLEASLRIATVVVPVALYFLLLGFLNTRRHPQMLSARGDFALLMAALCPIAFGPAIQVLGGGVPMLVVCSLLLVLAVRYLGRPGHSLVIYNWPLEDGRKSIRRILTQMGKNPTLTSRGMEIEEGTVLEISSFPILRNISLRLRGGDEKLWGEFQSRLTGRLRHVEAESSPMAVSMLMLATIMLVAPTALMVQQMPEIVRALTDLLQ